MIKYCFKRMATVFALVVIFMVQLTAQRGMVWSTDKDVYYTYEEGGIFRYELPSQNKVEVVNANDLKPGVVASPLRVQSFSFSQDGSKLLIFTNSKRVWRRNTRGDYWVLDLRSKELKQLGKDRPESSLMFAKISPDGTKAAYVSERNIYVEDLATGQVKRLTDTNGTPKLINGTFDWVYEEEFNCRDGFRWSPDSKRIAYWQVDANKIRDYYMLNTTDSVYSQVMPVEYPKVGFPPSPVRIGVVGIDDGKTRWMKVPGDPAENYIVRMEWTPSAEEVILQQLNRKQNKSTIYLCNADMGNAKAIYTDTDDAWVSTFNEWLGSETGWYWLDGGKSFLWVSEKDGWRHLYRISINGKKETLLTQGKYDVMNIALVDEKGGNLFFYASPLKSTQQYLYQVPLNGKGTLRLLSPAKMEGTHRYTVSPSGKYALWTFHNHFTQPMRAWVKLPDHQPL
ncbi:MAG: S9 family peptidase, partial [Bacteroidetes bacterium]